MSAVIAALTQSLAKPITRGLLPEAQAHAAIAAALARTTPASVDLADQLRIWLHILDLNIRNCETRRAETRASIKRLLRDRISTRAPWRRMMAEAHDINGADGFPLTEPEVSNVVKMEVYYSLPAAPRSLRHGA